MVYSRCHWTPQQDFAVLVLCSWLLRLLAYAVLGGMRSLSVDCILLALAVAYALSTAAN